MLETKDEIEEMLGEQGNGEIPTPEGDKGGEEKGEAGVGNPDPNSPDPEGALEGDKKPEEKAKPEEGGAPSTDFNFTEHFEGFEDIDAVKSAIDRSKAYTPEIEEELTTLRQSSSKIESLEKEIKELKGRQPFKNEKYYKLDKLSETNEEKADVYQRFLFGDKSDEAIVKLRMELDHPKRFKENPGYLQRQLEQKYADYLGDEFTQDDVEYQDAKTALGIDADAARAQFEDEINKVELPTIKTDEDVKADQKKFFEGWRKPFAEVKEGLNKISIPVLDEKDPTKSQGYMDFDIPEADNKEMQDIAAAHIVSQGLEPTKENIAEATKVALGVYLVNNFAKINTSFANQISKETGATWRKRVSNSQKPGADVNKGGTGNAGPADGSGEAVFNEIMLT